MAQYFLEADTDSKADWTEVPGGSAFDRVNDGTRQPTAPSTGSDYIESGTDNQICRLLLTTQTLSSETMVSARMWVYVATPAGRAVNLDLQDGSFHFAAKTIPAGTAASWQSVTYVGELTQTQIDNLRIVITTAVGTGTATVYSCYCELNTRTNVAQVANNRIMSVREQTTGLSTGAGFMGGDIWTPVDIGSGRSLILMGDCSIATGSGQQKVVGGNLNSPSGSCQFHRGPVLIMDSYDIEAANYTIFSGAAGDDYSYFAETTVNGKLSKRWPYYGIVRSGRLFVVGGIVPYDPIEGSEEAKWVGYSDDYSSNPTNPALWTWTYKAYARDSIGIGDHGIVDPSDGFVYLFSSDGPSNLVRSIYRLTASNFQNVAWEGGEWWTGDGWAIDRRGKVSGIAPSVINKRRARGRTYQFDLVPGVGGNAPVGGTVHRRSDNRYQVVSIFDSPLVGTLPAEMHYSLTAGSTIAAFPPVTAKFEIPRGDDFVYSGIWSKHLNWPGMGSDDQVWSYSTNGGLDPNPHDTSDFPRWVKALEVK